MVENRPYRLPAPLADLGHVRQHLGAVRAEVLAHALSEPRQVVHRATALGSEHLLQGGAHSPPHQLDLLGGARIEAANGRGIHGDGYRLRDGAPHGADPSWSHNMDPVTPQRGGRMVVNIHEAKARLSELVRRALDGEEVVLARRNRPLIRLQVIEDAPSKRRRGAWAGLIEMSDDFDDPLDDFDGYR